MDAEELLEYIISCKILVDQQMLCQARDKEEHARKIAEHLGNSLEPRLMEACKQRLRITAEDRKEMRGRVFIGEIAILPANKLRNMVNSYQQQLEEIKRIKKEPKRTKEAALHMNKVMRKNGMTKKLMQIMEVYRRQKLADQT